MLNFYKYFASNKATTMIDYALIITAISIVIMVLTLSMGEDLVAIFNQIVGKLGGG